jgi:hypothetical protein
MFRKSTVFVLGAGASWHYGYPTGEGLVESVISMARRLQQYCDNRLQCGQVVPLTPDYVEQFRDGSKGFKGAIDAWEHVKEECQVLINRLQSVRPLLIDHFLAWNDSLRQIGKLMIAAVILECEAIWLRERGNQNRRLLLANAPKPPSATKLAKIDTTEYHDDWCRFVIHKLVYGCTKSVDLLLKNDVHFVTFNYDYSLEQKLFSALTSIDMLENQDVLKFLTIDRIIHVYGSVHSPVAFNSDKIDVRIAEDLGNKFGTPLNHEAEFQPRKDFLDRCFVASKGLRTIDPHDKEENQASLKCASKWISAAKVVYILGYGFDNDNNRRIGLDFGLKGKTPGFPVGLGKNVMFTNFGNVNTVNKSASFLWYNNHNAFLSDSDGWADGTPNGDYYIEKSVRTVYEALEEDFPPLEAE